ncbi:unnamed protein product [Thlaspi arvense]|uniref:Cytochrome P450 n=1 Tax=Thlaspi arvense TaxID=13288 RepID=A0AAU9SF65_THLAR|nr:unnamed protein product [Thlaspi arvense]
MFPLNAIACAGAIQLATTQFNVGTYVPSLAWIDWIRGLDDELQKTGNEFDEFLERVVQDHVDGDGDRTDFVDILLAIQRIKSVGFEIDLLSIKAIILDVFVGGMDTSYTLMEWAMTELLRHPKCLNRLQEEVRTVCKGKCNVSQEDIQDVNYLRAVIKETLRLHPPLPLLVPHESTHDVRLRDYHIPAGTQVMINVWAIGREAATWGPDAEEFRPERHLDSSVDSRGQDFELIPFGAGRRICPAISFAAVLNELVLANLVHQFDWILPVKSAEDQTGVAESTGITIHRIVGTYVPWLAWIDWIRGLDGQLQKIGNDFDEFLERVVQDHVDGDRDRNDFVDVLLKIQREKSVGFDIDRLIIKAIILDIFVGGTDTSFTLMEWAMTELLRHPVCLNRLQEEVRTICKGKSSVSQEDIQDMNYLKAVMKETLRLHPPLPLMVPHESTQDVSLRDYHIPAGTQVIINVWAIGREATTWGPDAGEFRPERHLDSSVDFRGQDYELIPFGAGRRICPAISFAAALNEVVLANLVHRFDWRFPVESTKDQTGVAESTEITIHRMFPLYAIASSTTT